MQSVVHARTKPAAVPRSVHEVRCAFCCHDFDLFAAPWCEHTEGEPSRICPTCRRCLCSHPAYREPHFWKDPPATFVRQGFRRLFLFYL